MKQLICCVWLLIGVTTITQAQTWQWGRRGGGSGGQLSSSEKIVDMETDRNGNVYILTQIDAANDATITTQSTDSLLQTWGSKDAALISYDCSGKLRWVKIFGSDLDDYVTGMSMDTLGNIFVAMQTNRNFNVDIDSFVANPKKKSIGLIQYDTAGHFKWFRQPNPDSVSSIKNQGQYGAGQIRTLPNGDSYIFCGLGTGLIAGTTNLVVSIPGLYMLKYNVAGVPKELIKLDMITTDTTGFTYTNFNVTKSHKFIFTGIKSSSNAAFPIVGGLAVKHSIFLCCFSPTGSVLWRVENSDTTTGSILGKPLIDEYQGLIYVCGGSNGSFNGDTIKNFIVKNSYTFPYARVVPYIATFDTIGNGIWLSHGNTYEYPAGLTSVAKHFNGNLFAAGDGATVMWGSYKFDANKGLGFHIFMPSFDATNGAILSMDSLMGSSVTDADVITADNKNNIYVGGRLSSNIKVGSQTLLSAGGLSDFFIAKYGTNNCGLVPLKFISYAVVAKNEKAIENIWQTANEMNVSLFNVQRSINGKDFENIGTVMAKNKANNIYSFTDNNTPANITIYYRLQSIDYDGQVQYSDIKRIDVATQKNEIKIYPNPATDYITVTGNDIKEIQMIDCLGRILTTQKSLSSGSNLINLSSIKEGIYLIKVIDTSNNVSILKFVKE